MNKKFFAVLFTEIILFIIFFAISLFAGNQNLFTLQNHTLAKMIFTQIRLPRAVLVALSGMLLAGSGCIFQGFFRNPLAEPGVMGVTSGATLGAVASFLLPLSLGRVAMSGSFFLSPMPFSAFIGAICTGLLVICFSRKSESSAGIILVGTALGTFFSALTSIILLTKQNQLQSVYVWLLGSFSGRGWNEVFLISVPGALSFVLFGFCSRFLDVLSCGEETAGTLGLDVKKAKILVLLSGSLATASSVCAGGMIGFAGLICPHIMRKVYGAKNRHLLPLSVIAGGILLLACDTLARTVFLPSELPVGIITAVLGAPVFIWILTEKK